jgi:recombinational DNA repair protein (RecF pathway)
MCFPLSLLEVEMDMRAEKKLSRMEECRVLYPLPGLFVDATKNAVSLCTAELLFRLLREPLADGELFDYMEGAIRSLESGVWSAESFLLLFVPGVLGRLGVLPETGTALHVQYFPYLTAAGGLVLEVSEEQRKNGLRLMMKFGRKYVPDFPHLRSLSVLQSLEVL